MASWCSSIVASRLVEKYHKPVFIAELSTQEGIVKGSARGIPSLDLCEILKANAHLLTKWGGHKMAAGFSLSADKADAFCAAIVSTCNQMMINKESTPRVSIDVTLDDTTIDLFACAKSLTKLAPFGMENKKPLFYAGKLSCHKVSPLGRQGKHHKLDLVDPETNAIFSCVFWNTQNIIPSITEVIDIVFTPEINVFNGKERLQLVLADWRLSTLNLQIIDNKVSPQESIEEIIDLTPPSTPTKVASISGKQSLTDLRHFDNNKKIVSTAINTLGDNLAIFSEEAEASLAPRTFDRLSLPKRPHLLIKQFPPSPTVWQQVITTSGANKIYILGDDKSTLTDSASLIKRLIGLIRFVVNKKSGAVEASRISAALATTDLASALGLAILRKTELIDWYSDEGLIYLDLLDHPSESDIRQMSEYTQLEDVLKQINQFRQWCAAASIEDLQTTILGNLQEPTQPVDIATAELDFSMINTNQPGQDLDNVTTTKGNLAQ